jgi:hypothetical protein
MLERCQAHKGAGPALRGNPQHNTTACEESGSSTAGSLLAPAEQDHPKKLTSG